MKPQTEEQWLMVLAVIERLYAEVRAGNWDGLRQMLHGYTTPASVSPEPAGQPPKAYRLQDRFDPTRYVEYNPGMWDLILIPQPPTKDGKL